jgi:hypothetical protein
MVPTSIDCDRLEGRDLAALTPRLTDPGLTRTLMSLTSYYLLPTAVLLLLGAIIWAPINVLIASVLAWGVWNDWRDRREIIAASLRRREFHSRRQEFGARRGRAENPSRVSGISGGMWVCDKAEYDRQRKAYRREHR